MVLYEILTARPQLTLAFSSGIAVVAVVCFIFRARSKVLSRTAGPRSARADAPEIIIVGSGILGSAMAAALARDGRRVVVVERDLRQPDRIVGELLQPGGRKALDTLGLQDCVKGLDAHVIKGYVIHERRSSSQVHIPYPKLMDGESEEGRAFHHGRFVQALRETAMKEPNAKYIEGTVTKLIEEDGVVRGVLYKEKGDDVTKEVRAPLTVVADGCFSRFRKSLVTETPKTRSHFVGLIMTDCPQWRDHHAEVVLPDGAPVLVYRISSRDTRVLVDVQGQLPRDLRHFLRTTTYQQLPEHLQEPFLEAVESGRIRSMPNSFLPPAAAEQPGAIVLGDAFNMRHPLTGGGMSVALNDVVIWRQLFRRIPDLADHHAILRSQRQFALYRKKNHAFVVNILAMALYELFSAEDDYLKSLKTACFEYFKLGGECVNGPVGLLSVLSPKPHVLIGHFFAVALYAVYFSFKSERWWAVHRSTAKSIGIFRKACGVLFPLVWTELKTIVKY